MRRLIYCLAVVLVLSLLTAACAETLRVGMECDYAPFNWTQTEETEFSAPINGGGFADGYDVRIARRVADYLGYDLEIVKTEWDGLIMSVMSGKIDAIIAGMSPTEERLLAIDFTDAYYESDLVIVVRKDSAYANAAQLADFSGARIVGQLNTFHDSVIDQIPGVKHQVPMDTFPTMIIALTAGAVDGYVSERPGAESAVATNPDLTFIAFEPGMGFACDPSDTTVAVGVAKGSDLTARINEALQTISAEERVQIMTDALNAQPSAQ